MKLHSKTEAVLLDCETVQGEHALFELARNIKEAALLETDAVSGSLFVLRSLVLQMANGWLEYSPEYVSLTLKTFANIIKTQDLEAFAECANLWVN